MSQDFKVVTKTDEKGNVVEATIVHPASTEKKAGKSVKETVKDSSEKEEE